MHRSILINHHKYQPLKSQYMYRVPSYVPENVVNILPQVLLHFEVVPTPLPLIWDLYF